MNARYSNQGREKTSEDAYRMGRRTVGLGFCGIAAFLFAARYVSAAIYGSNVASGGARFSFFLESVGSGLVVLSIVSLVVGIIYLVWGEIGNS